MSASARKIGIDARSLRHGPPGVATYVRNLLENIPELDPFDSRFPRNNLAFNLFRVPWAQLARRWKIYHAPAYTAPPLNFCPVVLAVHDVAYLVNEKWYPYRLDRARRAFYRASLFRADRILVPTEYSGEQIAALFPQLRPRIRRIHLGVSPFFRKDPEMARRAARELNLPPRFLLHVGDIHSRRNVDQIAAAAQSTDLPLVLVGRVLKGGEAFAGWPRRFESLSPELLKGVYSAATVFVYASEYEGFGLPILEAMACEVPVVSSNRSCLPEVCGEAAVLVEPRAEALAQGVRDVLKAVPEWVEKGLRRIREFSWRKTAEATVSVYRELSS